MGFHALRKGWEFGEGLLQSGCGEALIALATPPGSPRAWRQSRLCRISHFGASVDAGDDALCFSPCNRTILTDKLMDVGKINSLAIKQACGRWPLNRPRLVVVGCSVRQV